MADRRLNVVGRCAGWLKGNCGVGTRHDELAVTFMAFVKLAMAQQLQKRLRDTTLVMTQ